MKCYHYNFVSIFNSPYGYAYCPDCGKGPLSVHECGAAIMRPGLQAAALAIARDLLTDITKNPPTPMNDLNSDINILAYILKTQGLTTDEIQQGLNWINQAQSIYAENMY